jgi:hypothetical protein
LSEPGQLSFILWPRANSFAVAAFRFFAPVEITLAIFFGRRYCFRMIAGLKARRPEQRRRVS